MLFSRLERSHPNKYLAMGRPSLFLRNNPLSAFATLKFLIRREHRSLDDPGLSKLSTFMLWFLIVYLLLFVALCGFIGAETARYAAAA